MKTNIKVPVFIPHLGCNNDCVFCNQVKITGHINSVKDSEIEDIFNEYTSNLENKENVEIAFFGGSFTGLRRDVQEKYLNIANNLVKKHNLKGIRLSTRPDYINNDIMELLSKYKITAIELGVQSMDIDVLRMSKRGHSVFDVYNAVNLIKKTDYELGLQMMFDLPADTKEKSINTAKKLINMKPDFVRLYPTLVLKDTELEKMYYAKTYIPWDYNYMLDTLTMVYSMFLNANIDVIRLGLHSSDDVFISSIVAGHYHSAFREVVLSNMFKISLDKTLESFSTIYVNRSDKSIAAGINAVNKKYFLEKNIKFKIKESDIKRFHYELDGRIYCIYDITKG